MAQKNCMVFVTSDKTKTVKKIADVMIKERLSACVNTISGVNSVYHWKGRTERAKETLMIMKTKKSLVPALIKRIKELHDYEVPEITAIDISAGNPDYMDWINKETKSGVKK